MLIKTTDMKNVTIHPIPNRIIASHIDWPEEAQKIRDILFKFKEHFPGYAILCDEKDQYRFIMLTIETLEKIGNIVDIKISDSPSPFNQLED